MPEWRGVSWLTSGTELAAAAAMMALAVMLLVAHFGGRRQRAFALYLFLAGVRIVTTQAGALGGQWGAALGAMHDYVALGAVFALLHFFLSYHVLRSMWWLPTVLAAGSVAWLALDPCAASCMDGGFRAGPLLVVIMAHGLVAGTLAVILARRANSIEWPKDQGTRLVCLGLAATALFEGLLFAWQGLFYGYGWVDAAFASGPWVVPVLVVGHLAVLPAVVAVAWLARYNPVRTFAVAVLVAAVAGVVVSRQDPWGPGVLAAGVVRLVLPVTGTVALLRFCLFDADAKIRYTIQQGTVAGAIVAAFFVISETAQQVFQGWSGSAYIGIGAAGALVFALSPLDSLGRRVAHAAVPEHTGIDIYRRQAALVWSDGTMGRKERMLLDQLREQLGLDVATAAKLESEAASRPA